MDEDREIKRVWSGRRCSQNAEHTCLKWSLGTDPEVHPDSKVEVEPTDSECSMCGSHLERFTEVEYADEEGT